MAGCQRGGGLARLRMGLAGKLAGQGRDLVIVMNVSQSRRMLAAVAAAAATLAALAPASAAPAGAAARATRAAPGAQLWVARYNGQANSGDFAHSMAVSPGGSRVFVTGGSDGGPATGDDYATAAYSAAAGGQLWASRYSGAGDHADIAHSVAVSPGGSRVFVTGESHGRGTGEDYATLAYSAATGRQLWVSRYNGPANKFDAASAVAVSPAGTRVYVTGTSPGRGTNRDLATAAYSAATGRQLWVNRYTSPFTSPGLDFAAAAAVAVSPAGTTVFVTAESSAGSSGRIYVTVAYSAATGRRLWVSRYHGPRRTPNEAPASLAVSPGGTRVFVTGYSLGRLSSGDYATVAYSAATGKQLWVSRYNGPANRYDAASSVAVSPRGGRVYVTGTSRRLTLRTADATIAYSAATGKQLWVSRYNGPADGSSGASAVAVSPAGTTVYVTGGTAGPTGADYATVAYSAAAGTQLWASRYNGPDNEPDGACCLAVSPDGTTVLVTGQSDGLTTSADYATVAYRG